MTPPSAEHGWARRDVIVVGASAGGVESLVSFVRALPRDLPAAVLVVLHLPPSGASALPEILARAGELPVHFASGADDLRPGRVLLAPPDRHLLVIKEQLRVSRGPRENGHRPAVDVLFRSAARSLGPRVVAVVLSGALDDGTSGALVVEQEGGAVLVQKPTEAAYPSMPESVLARVASATAGSVVELAATADRLSRTPVPVYQLDHGAVSMSLEAELEELVTQAEEHQGPSAGFECPDCHGSMFDIGDGQLPRLRCRVGHAWSSAGLLLQQSEAMEGALWMAWRSLEERAALSRDLAERAVERGSTLSASRFLEQAREASHSAGLVRKLIETGSSGAPVEAVGHPSVAGDG